MFCNRRFAFCSKFLMIMGNILINYLALVVLELEMCIMCQ